MTFLRIMRVLLTCIILALAFAFCGCTCPGGCVTSPEPKTKTTPVPCEYFEYRGGYCPQLHPYGCRLYLTTDGGR